MPNTGDQINGASSRPWPESSFAPVAGDVADVAMTEKLMRALGAVVITCIAVVILAPLLLKVLPGLLLLTLVAWIIAQLIDWSRFKGY